MATKLRKHRYDFENTFRHKGSRIDWAPAACGEKVAMALYPHAQVPGPVDCKRCLKLIAKGKTECRSE